MGRESFILPRPNVHIDYLNYFLVVRWILRVSVDEGVDIKRFRDVDWRRNSNDRGVEGSLVDSASGDSSSSAGRTP